MRKIFFLFLSISVFACQRNDDSDDTNDDTISDELYFPTTTQWETVSPEALNWNTENIADLNAYLEETHTKGFIILQNGKIAFENYFNGASASTPVAWNSAGKTLTSMMVGIAEEQGFLDLQDPATNYLGSGWTSMTAEQEDTIKIKNMLTMTSGGDYTVENTSCYDPECLLYLNDPGEAWFYHNAFYTLLQPVLDKAYPEGWDMAFAERLKNKIGMTGSWVSIGYNNVFFSKTQSMARFGLLVLADGKWNGETIINNPEYLKNMSQTSQQLNLSYGYLWWLNGKESYILPGSTQQFSGKLVPDAPDDMFAALGKDDKKLYIIPSKNMVIVRLGDKAQDDLLGPSAYDNLLWQKINAVID